MTATARTYRAAGLEGASHLGLLLATYDVLAEDIRLAGEAAAQANIGERCRHSGHATLLLGHLESWVPLLEEPVLETSLIRFYAHVRAELMRLQSAVNPADFTALALQVGETRAAWQHRGNQPPAAILQQPVPAAFPPRAEEYADVRGRLSCCA